MMSHWSSLKQRENCCSPYSFNLPPVFPTYSTLCTLAGQSCPFGFFFYYIHLSSTVPLAQITAWAFHLFLPLLLLPPSPEIFCLTFSISAFPLFPPLRSPMIRVSPTLPQSSPPSLPLSSLSFLPALCVCVYVTVFFLWLTREMFSCCWALEEAAWQNYSSVRNTQRRIHVACPSVRRQGAVSNSGNLERFQNFKCVHKFWSYPLFVWTFSHANFKCFSFN